MSDNYELINKNQYLNMSISLHSVNNFMFHLHNELELLIVLKGSIIITIGLEKYELFENDFIVVNKNEVHSSSRTNEENICLAIEINSTIIDKFYPGFSKLVFDCKSFEHADKNQVTDKIRYHIASIIWGINKKETGFQFDIWLHAIKISKELLINFKSGELINEDNIINEDRTKRIQRIINFIDDKFEDGVTLDDIAKKEGMNSYYISHFIKESIGITFQDYKNYKRLDKAEKLLLRTNDKITDIALASGFPSAKSLNNIFLKYYSCTPTEYRKEKSSMTQSENYYISNAEQIKRKTYFDVDRKAAFAKLFTYLAPHSIDESTLITISNKKHIDVNMKGIPLVKNWRKLITFGRAAEGLRQDWRNHLKVVQKEIGFEYVRFHGIFSDEMMVCNLDEKNNIIYNWTYVDNLFDYLQEVNIKPFVELGFMPSELKRSDETIFWWKANVAQPKDINLWTGLVKEFIRHCINRYGLKEVESWYFEVWNEPELPQLFWIGTKEEYFEFYKETALAVKSISKDLRVGGPSITHQALKEGPWLEDFITYCLDNDAPLDFITLHIYPESFAMDDMDEINMDEIQKFIRDNGKDMNLNVMNQMMSQLKNIYYDKDHTIDTINNAIKRINTISPKKLELHITEWSSTAFGRNLISDTCYTAAFIVKNVLQSINTVDSLGYWTFTDILEEFKAGLTPFHGGFGLLNINGIKKPGFHAYYFLSKLGNEILSQEKDYIVTKKGDGIQILAYNFAYFDDLFLQGDTSALTYKDRYKVFESKGNLEEQVELQGLWGEYKITRYELNKEHGSAFDEWLKLGSPENMTTEEIEYLKMKSHPKITTKHININDIYHLNISIPVHGLELIIINKLY